MHIQIREGTQEYLPALKRLFVDTIQAVCSADYTPRQIDAWLHGAGDVERWERMIREQYVSVAELDHTIVGFCSLLNGDHIDFLFVHKDYQRCGIAHRLYASVETRARLAGAHILTADVSKTARKFFLSKGFQCLQEQSIRPTNYMFADCLGYLGWRVCSSVTLISGMLENTKRSHSKGFTSSFLHMASQDSVSHLLMD